MVFLLPYSRGKKPRLHDLRNPRSVGGVQKGRGCCDKVLTHAAAYRSLIHCELAIRRPGAPGRRLTSSVRRRGGKGSPRASKGVTRDTGHAARSAVAGRRPREYPRSEEHTSELQSREKLVCRLQLEKKKI